MQFIKKKVKVKVNRPQKRQKKIFIFFNTIFMPYFPTLNIFSFFIKYLRMLKIGLANNKKNKKIF